jgi:hypothetical protein
MSTDKSADKPSKTTAVEQPDENILPFTFEGKDYTLDKSVFSDLDFREAAEEEKDIKVIRLLVGNRNFEKFKSAGKNGKRTIEEFNLFGAAAYEAVGTNLGESKD